MDNTSSITREGRHSMTASETPGPITRYPTLAAAFLRPFMKQAEVQHGERVLDIAPVGGEAVVEAAIRARHRGEVLSVSSRPEALEAVAHAARDAGMTTIRTARMDPGHLDLEEAYWDVVTCHLGLSDMAAVK
jgi:ubiquinone/menaquinone biosynthesis C-methylase UbiE